MTPTTAGILLGGLAGGALFMVVWSLVPPAPVDPAAFIARLTATQTVKPVSKEQDPWLGRLVMRLPVAGWVAPDRTDLAILRRSDAWYFTKLASRFLLGLLLPTAVTVLCGLLVVLGFPVPLLPPAVPLVAALGLGLVLMLLARGQITREAKEARVVFARSLTSFVDLVIIEVRSGSQTGQALEYAARVGDDWVFLRISEALEQAQMAKQSPWDGLQDLSRTIGVPQLGDIAYIIRLAGAQDAAIADQLQSAVETLRAGRLAKETTAANTATTLLAVPVGLLFLVFMGIVLTPLLLTMAGN